METNTTQKQAEKEDSLTGYKKLLHERRITARRIEIKIERIEAHINRKIEGEKESCSDTTLSRDNLAKEHERIWSKYSPACSNMISPLEDAFIKIRKASIPLKEYDPLRFELWSSPYLKRIDYLEDFFSKHPDYSTELSFRLLALDSCTDKLLREIRHATAIEVSPDPENRNDYLPFGAYESAKYSCGVRERTEQFTEAIDNLARKVNTRQLTEGEYLWLMQKPLREVVEGLVSKFNGKAKENHTITEELQKIKHNNEFHRSTYCWR